MRLYHGIPQILIDAFTSPIMPCNEYQTKLYEELMQLTSSTKKNSFFFKDKYGPRNEQCFRIFSYMMASYEDFCLPSALECRGIMYEIDSNGNALRLACFPMEKFFNLNENPFTSNLDMSSIKFIEDKADGSLISTYLIADGHLKLKSKASLTSSQVQDSERWLNQPAQAQLHSELCKMAQAEYTVNMEWVAPSNHIVLDYPYEELRILTVRSNHDGSYLDRDDLPEWAQKIRERWTHRISSSEEELSEFLKSIPSQTGVEGYVVQLSSGLRVKIKTKWYLERHRMKDVVDSPLMLYRAVLEERVDDYKSQYHDDAIVLARIEEMEGRIRTEYQSLREEVESFYEENRGVDRKTYAMYASTRVQKMRFAIAMKRFEGLQVDYKAFMLEKDKAILRQWGKETSNLTVHSK